jgi:hypothetical protein
MAKTPRRPDGLLMDIKMLAMANRRSRLAGLAGRYSEESSEAPSEVQVPSRQDVAGRNPAKMQALQSLRLKVADN